VYRRKADEPIPSRGENSLFTKGGGRSNYHWEKRNAKQLLFRKEVLMIEPTRGGRFSREGEAKKALPMSKGEGGERTVRMSTEKIIP